MRKLVDFEDVQECVKIGIKHGWTLKEFLESMSAWNDFVEDTEWVAVKDKLPEEGSNTWILLADGTIDEDTYEGGRGESAVWASGEEFIKSGWWSYCDDSKTRITHWKAQTKPKVPMCLEMEVTNGMP